MHYDELAPTLVEDTIKATDIIADEYHGKNACTAWVNFDGTTTPPTIRDSFNVSDVVRVSTGQFSIIPEAGYDNTNFSVVGGGRADSGNVSVTTIEENGTSTVSSVNVTSFYVASASGGVANRKYSSVQIFGGKN